jgi:hypothetical protein
MLEDVVFPTTSSSTAFIRAIRGFFFVGLRALRVLRGYVVVVFSLLSARPNFAAHVSTHRSANTLGAT